MFNLQLSLSSGVWPPYVSCIESGHNIYKWGATHTKLAALEWTFLAGGEMRNACTNSLCLMILRSQWLPLSGVLHPVLKWWNEFDKSYLFKNVGRSYSSKSEITGSSI